MNQRMFALSLAATALVTLLPGCAGSGVLARNSDLSGIWHGTLGQCRADQYEDEARGNRVTLRNTEGPWPWVTAARNRPESLSNPATSSSSQQRIDAPDVGVGAARA